VKYRDAVKLHNRDQVQMKETGEYGIILSEPFHGICFPFPCQTPGHRKGLRRLVEFDVLLNNGAYLQRVVHTEVRK